MAVSHRVQSAEDRLAEARDLTERLAAQCAPEGERVLRCVRDALGNPNVFLPRLPEAAIQAAQVVDSPRCDVLDLADTLNAEPSIAERVVHVANVGIFSGTEPVHTPRDAIVRMGIRETRNVVMGLVLRNLILEGRRYEAQRKALWHHSLATAACAHGLLCELAFEDGVGFLAGLAHDVGRACLYLWLGERGEREVDADVLRPIADALHAPLGAAVLAHWRLRRDLVEAVRWHHEPGPAAGPSSSMALALLVADWMAYGLEGEAPHAEADASIPAALEALGLTAHRAEALQTQSRARLDELLKIL